MLLSDRLRQMREATAPAERIRAPKPRKVAKVRRGRVKDAGFLAWVHRTFGCLVASRGFGGCSGQNEFHHVRRFGEPKNDRRGFLLCSGHHQHGKGPDAIHRIGKKAFEARFGLSIEAEAARYWEKWAETRS